MPEELCAEARAQQQPSEAERLELLLVGTSVAELAIMKVDLATGRAIWSEGMYALLGIAAGSVQPTRATFAERIHPEDRAQLAAQTQIFMETGEPQQGSFRILLADGRIRHLETRARVLEFEQRVPKVVVCVLQDVSASRLAQAALRASEEQFRSFFEHSSLGCAMTSTDGRFVRVNRELCALLGYSEPELLDMHFAQLTHPDDREAAALALRQVHAGELQVHRREKRYLHKNGEPIWVALNVAPVRGHDGAVVSFSVQIKDIRDRKRTELALQESERRFRTLATHAPIGIFEADRDGRCTFVNARWTELTGLTADHALGAQWLEAVHPDDRATVQQAWERAAAERAEMSLEFRFVRADQRLVWVAIKALTIRNEVGRVLSYLGVINDITEHKLAEQNVIAAVNAAESASLAKSEFLARMSHEIRTPMNSVIGMTRLVLETALSEEQRDHLSMAHAAAKGLLRVINDILDFSKIEARRLDLEETAFELRSCVREALGGLAHRAAEKGLSFGVSISQAVPRVLVGDPHRLQQVLINLVGNALKFTERGGIDVTANVTSLSADRVTLEFTVRDTGIGVSLGQQKQIFVAFAQANEGIARKFGGTGLGLSICTELVDMMHGKLWLQSELGRGSQFHFSVELRQARGQNAVTPLPIAAVSGELHPNGTTASGERTLRILVAEDNAMNQRLIEAILRRDRHSVELVDSGRAALERLATEAFDLVLMDVQMPHMTGLEAVRRLREHEAGSGKRVPVIALTAQAMAGDRERCLAAGMDAYVSKPLSPSELKRHIAELTATTDRRQQDDAAKTTPAAFDRDTLLRRLGHDQALYAEIAALFRRDAHALLRELAQGVHARQPEPSARAAHRLSGMLINLGASRASSLAKQLEHDVRTGAWSEATARLPELSAETYRVDAALGGTGNAASTRAPER